MSTIESATEPTAVSIPSTGGADATALGVLTLTCPERPGIVQAVTSFLLKHDFDIVEHHQFDDSVRIEQEVIRVDHTYHPTALFTVGQDAECLALSRAVRWHCQQRILFHGASTVVFR